MARRSDKRPLEEVRRNKLFGKDLSAAMKRSGLSDKDVAAWFPDKAGRHPSEQMVRNWRYGLNWPDVKRLQILKGRLGVSPSEEPASDGTERVRKIIERFYDLSGVQRPSDDVVDFLAKKIAAEEQQGPT